MITRVSAALRTLFLGLTLALISATAGAESFTGGMPVSPQPDESSLKDGLWVKYYYDYYDHIDEVSVLTQGVEGDPIPNIAHRTKTGNVMTANKPMGVGVHIRGFIHLEETGKYVFRIESNDGIRAHIGGIHLWTDPEIHGNRWSRPLEYEVTEPGWYELHFDYYQRKGTSALQLAWTRPGASEEEIVPPEAFRHQ